MLNKIKSRFSSGKNKKFNSITRLLALALLLISISVGFINTDENSEAKKVSVKIKIGNSSCTGSGICQVTKVPKDQFSDVSGLGPYEFYCSFSWGMSGGGTWIKTSRDMMSEQTYTQYFSGTNFVLENDFIIPKNTIGNKKAITLLSGSYPIQREGEQILIGLLIP